MTNELEIQGEIVQICTPQTTEKKDGSGVFVQQTFVILTDGQYPKKVAILIKGQEKVANFEKYNKVGQFVKVKVNAESREYNGKWYTDLTSYRIDAIRWESQPGQSQVPQAKSQPVTPESDDDSLPF